jgi:signal transduction histidine kinase
MSDNATRARSDEIPETEDFYTVLLSMAGHDLRSRLQVITSAHRLLEKRLDGAEKVYLEHGQVAATQLSRQLEGILEAFRLYQSNHVVLSPVALAPVMRSIEREAGALARHKRIDLVVEPADVRVCSNAILLASILRNLVENALKYTPPGGRVVAACKRRGATSVQIDVCDTGIGITAEHLPKVFDAFYRGEDDHSEGVGLGLFIAKRAARLLHHQLDVSSEPGRGSRFSLIADLA